MLTYDFLKDVIYNSNTETRSHLLVPIMRNYIQPKHSCAKMRQS